MDIYLVRHGETSWNLDGKLQGHRDIPLNEKGIEQSKFVAENFKEYGINKIYTSPLSRATSTAKIIGDIIHAEIEVATGLKEMFIEEGFENIGDENEYLKEYKCEFLNFQENSFDMLKKIANNSKNENIIIVGHGTWIKALICKIKELDFFDSDDLVIKNCSISIIENNEVFSVKLTNSYLF